MLPDSLKSSYAQYKDDTERFATWLLHAAEKCGHQSSRLLAGDSANSINGTTNGKGKAKAKAKSAPLLPLKYKTTISELRTFGEVVAKSSIRVPTTVLAVARRAVTLRKDAASWFVGKGNAASNKRHAHFVEVLEEICESLEWRTNGTSKQDSNTRSATATPANTGAGAKNASEAWVNQFATLTVEEPEEIPEPSDSSKQLVQVELVEEADVDAEERELKHLSHAYFQVFCLFRDLQNMRAFIRQTWEDYRDNKLDIMTASVVTDTAMQLARAAAEELVHIPSVSPEDLSDEVQAQLMLYDMACTARGNHEPASNELGLTFNVDMADEAEWCFIPTSTLLQSFVPVMQQENVPDFKKGHFGDYDPKADRSRMSVAERFNEDKILLLELLPEFCLIQTMGGSWPVRDEFTHGFSEFVKNKKVTLWLCFAAQVLLDIQHTLRSSPDSAWNDLRMAGLRISKTIADFKKLSSTHPKPAFWPKEGDQEIENIQHCVDSSIKFDPQHAVWQLIGTNQTHEEHFFLKRNPVLSGLLTFHLNLRMQVIGQSLVNQWYDVQQMAFLYNLVQAIPEARLSWPDIEAFIKIHGENYIFIGNRPKNAAESLNRLEAATGISSISRFARDARRTGPWHVPDGKGNRLLKPTTKVANMFRDSYTKPEQTRNIANADIGMLLDELASSSPDARKGSTKRGKKNKAVVHNPEKLLLDKWSNKHSLGALQFLALVRTKLHEEEPVLMFNYFGMHQRSIEMLRRIRDKEHHKFVQYFTAGYMPDESMISNLVILIHHVARGSAASSQVLGIGRGPDTSVVSRIVMSCGDVMRGYLKTKGDVACRELRTFCKNKTPLFVEEAVGGGEDEEAQKKFVYWFGLEEVVDPRAMASLMTGIPLS